MLHGKGAGMRGGPYGALKSLRFWRNNGRDAGAAAVVSQCLQGQSAQCSIAFCCMLLPQCQCLCRHTSHTLTLALLWVCVQADVLIHGGEAVQLTHLQLMDNKIAGPGEVRACTKWQGNTLQLITLAHTHMYRVLGFRRSPDAGRKHITDDAALRPQRDHRYRRTGTAGQGPPNQSQTLGKWHGGCSL